MDLYRCIKKNGFWTTLKMIDSPEFMQELYEATRESYIHAAYTMRIERFGDSAEIRRAIDDIHEYEDDPLYMTGSSENWEDVKQRLRSMGVVMNKANDQDPVRLAQYTLDAIMTLYGFSESQKKDCPIITQQQRALEVSERYSAMFGQHRDGWHKKKGDLVLLYVITYECRIDQNQARCCHIEQMQREGLIEWDSLFPNGGNHATVRRDVEAFDRYIYSEWERSLAIKDTNKEERKREYRLFLRDRERNWGKEYREWLARGK